MHVVRSDANVSATYVGRAIKRREDLRLVKGEGSFTADLTFPGMLEAAVLRSIYAHARIVHLDVEPARRLEGVIAVYTGADLEGKVKPFTRSFFPEVSPLLYEQTNLVIRPYRASLLATEKTVRVGDPIAVVVAEDRYAAEDALEAIEIDYEPLEAILDPEVALRLGAPTLIEDSDDNVHASFTLAHGDIEAAFRGARHRFGERIRVGRSSGAPMETRGTIALFDKTRRELLTYSTQQRPHHLRTYLSEMLTLPETSIRVVCPDMGGSFGGGIYSEEAFISGIAMDLGRPIRWIEDRRENLQNARHSRDHIHDVELALDGDGRILALRDRFLIDAGAYNPFAITLSLSTSIHLRGQFKIDTFEITALSVATNKLQNTPVRGAGRPEAVFVMDRILDAAAASIGMDPVEIRRKNLIPADEMPYALNIPFRDGTPLAYDSGDYPAQLALILEAAGYQDLRAEQARARERGRHIGIGISCYVEGSGYGPHERASVRIDGAGNIVVHSGSNPHGQAHETTLAQVCADQLGADIDSVTVRCGDTSLIKDGVGTFASRSAVTAGSAVWIAAGKLRERVTSIAAELLEIDKADVEIDRGRIFPRGAPDGHITFGEIVDAGTADWDPLTEGAERELQEDGHFSPPTITFASGSHLAVVEVDPETGHVEILKYVVVEDCGRMLNPMVVEGQIHGGVAHGIGNALYEEVLFDESGQLITASLMDYLLPTASEVPAIHIEHQEFLSPLNPLGVKGCGEGGTVSVPAAVANGIVDAMKPLTIRLNEMPMTPERVRKAILEATEAS